MIKEKKNERKKERKIAIKTPLTLKHIYLNTKEKEIKIDKNFKLIIGN